MSQLYDHHVAVGMTVYDTVGYTVGTVQAYNPQGGYLAVRTGGLFRRTDRSIPLDAVDHSGATGGVFLPRHGARQDVSLLLSQDDLTADRYNAPPIRGTRGMGGDGQRVPPTTRASDHACLRPRVPTTMCKTRQRAEDSGRRCLAAATQLNDPRRGRETAGRSREDSP